MKEVNTYRELRDLYFHKIKQRGEILCFDFGVLTFITSLDYCSLNSHIHHINIDDPAYWFDVAEFCSVSLSKNLAAEAKTARINKAVKADKLED